MFFPERTSPSSHAADAYGANETENKITRKRSLEKISSVKTIKVPLSDRKRTNFVTILQKPPVNPQELRKCVSI